MANVGDLESAAAKRKERLKALRKKKEGEVEVKYNLNLIIYQKVSLRLFLTKQ